MDQKTHELIEKMYNEVTSFKCDIKDIKTEIGTIKDSVNQLTAEVEHKLNDKVKILFDANNMSHEVLTDLNSKIDVLKNHLDDISMKTVYNDSRIIEIVSQMDKIKIK